MRQFWETVKCTCDADMPDVINDDIWNSSTTIHTDGHFLPSALTPVGSIGAQQAMLDPAFHPFAFSRSVVPWVPDILGEDWTHPEATFVVGPALAGFIEGYSGRNKTLSLSAYLAAPDWRTFQRKFIAHVVRGDENHYEKLAPLLGHISRFAVFDLCRSSLVVRTGAGTKGRQDQNINTRFAEHRAVFALYAEHPKSKYWTKSRLVNSKGRIIVALGFTAEYGLVRLFAENGMNVRDTQTGLLWAERRFARPENWTYAYAGGSRDRSLKKRYDPPCWWQIEDLTGKPRWALVPVVHPSSWADDPEYARTCQLIAAARGQAYRW